MNLGFRVWIDDVYDGCMGMVYLYSRWWFQLFFLRFTPNLGEMIQFDERMFQLGWFNHQVEYFSMKPWKNPGPRKSPNGNCQKSTIHVYTIPMDLGSFNREFPR